MNMKKNPKNGDMLSLLGFGCMRLPTRGLKINDREAAEVLLRAVDLGVNYLDTAYFYHNGDSEAFLGRVLTPERRDKLYIADKLPPFMVKKPQDMDKIFGVQRARLKTDRIDYYMMHMLQDMATWDRMKSLGIEKWIDGRKAAGDIVNFGFSYHGGREQFKSLIDAYPWDFCQIQYNYLDVNNQAGRAGLEYAQSKGVPVFVMEPLRGGKLAAPLPKQAGDYLAKHSEGRSPAQMALRYVWSHPGVTLLLSGMNTVGQVEENAAAASDSAGYALTGEEQHVFQRVRELILSKTAVECTGCGYCLPCPHGVDIPTCFSLFNEKMSGVGQANFMKYMQATGSFSPTPANASRCRACGACQARCPQGIPIADKLRQAARKMEGPLFRPVTAAARLYMGGKGKV